MKQFEQVKSVDTPEQMRAEIHRLSYHDPLIRRATDLADHLGLSAEDRYTLLSYHLLQAKIQMQQELFEMKVTSSVPSFVLMSHK